MKIKRLMGGDRVPRTELYNILEADGIIIGKHFANKGENFPSVASGSQYYESAASPENMI